VGKLILPFHSYELRSRQSSSRRLVNCYAEQMPAQGKSPLRLRRAPGIRSFATLPAGTTRGMCVHNGTLYVVAGGNLYSVSSAGDVTTIGSVSSTGRVTMVSNRTQLVIVCAPDGYVYDGTLTQITHSEFVAFGATMVDALDGFALFIRPSSDRFFMSNFLDATDFSGFGYATAEGAPDNLQALLVDHRQLFLFGAETTEIWYNAGSDPDMPFAREQNGFIEVGCGAAATPVKADNAVFWLDNHRIARRLVDYTPTRISTHAIEEKWVDYNTVDDAYGMTYVHEGHWFWVLTFPSESATWAYDISTGEWHQLESKGEDGRPTAWRVGATAYCYGLNIVGDTESSELGVIDSATYTEWGNTQRMEWTYPSVYTEGRRAFHRRLQIDFEAGVGLTAGQGVDPEVMLYCSDDGGVSFSRLPNRTIGALGQYRKRAAWHRLGSSADRVYRAAVSDPVPVTVWDTQLEVEGGRL